MIDSSSRPKIAFMKKPGQREGSSLRLFSDVLESCLHIRFFVDMHKLHHRTHTCDVMLRPNKADHSLTKHGMNWTLADMSA